jgi:hypothetical protein
MVIITNPGTESFESTREHQSFRLDAKLISVIEDIAKGVEEGEAGLKSSGIADADYSCGVSRSNALSMYRNASAIEDEDECFNVIGDLVAKGFSFAEVAQMVSLGGGATHLLTLERWCQLVKLTCINPGEETPTKGASLRWRGSSLHERRERCRRAMSALRRTPTGTSHAAILHIVYGWPDPFVKTLTQDTLDKFGREFAPLARYTDVVESHRQEMIHREARQRTRVVDGTVPLTEYRERAARADRCLTSGDALRDALAPPRARLETETKEDYREHVAGPHQHRRDGFITQVRVDANRMLTRASLAYLESWNRN